MIEVIVTQGLSGRDYCYIDVRGPVTVSGARTGSVITTELGSYNTEHLASRLAAAVLKARQEPGKITRVQA